MKYLKVTGLVVAVVAATMAFAGAASATVLCANNTEPCTSPYKAGTEVKISLKPGTSASMKAGFAEVTCAESTLTGKTANDGSATETVRGLPATWVTGGCNVTVDVLKPGELEIHHIPGTSAGTLTAKGAEVTVSSFGVHCVYGPGAGTDIGRLNGSSENGGGTATVEAKANYQRLSGGFLCANPALWTASYVVTTPDFLNVKGS